MVQDIENGHTHKSNKMKICDIPHILPFWHEQLTPTSRQKQLFTGYDYQVTLAATTPTCSQNLKAPHGFSCSQ